MAILKKPDISPRDAKPAGADNSPLARVMREFEELVLGYETGLLCSLEDAEPPHTRHLRAWRRPDIRQEACRLAISELSAHYTRKHIRRSLSAAESLGKRVEEQLHHAAPSTADLADAHDLHSVHNGYFRLYSNELFDMLGQPTDLRFGTLRFHAHAPAGPPDFSDPEPAPAWISIELALNSSYFVADSMETLPYHTFRMPPAPSPQNRGILSRKPEDNGAFPDYDSWLLFTFLGSGCLKLEVPVEMCADVYGGALCGRENEEITFWGVFVDDDHGLDA